MKVRDAIRLIEKLGVDVPRGTLNSILKEAGLERP